MAEYVTQQRIQAAIPGPILTAALDDDRDGQADDGVLDEVVAAASQAVDGLLSGRYAVPFANPGPTVMEAAFIFACELIYDRRETGEKNPWKARGNKFRERLEKIGNGDLPLDAKLVAAFKPGAVVAERVDLDASLR